MDVREFRVRAIQRLIVAIRERAQDEIVNAAVYERQEQERQHAANQEQLRQVRDHQDAIRNYEILQAEVDQFVSSQNQAQLTLVERAWQAAQEAENELNRTRETQTQTRPPNTSRGRGRRTRRP